MSWASMILCAGYCTRPCGYKLGEVVIVPGSSQSTVNILWPRNQLRTLCHIKIYPSNAVVKNLIENIVLSKPESLKTSVSIQRTNRFINLDFHLPLTQCRG